MQTEFKLTGLKCKACVAKLQSALEEAGYRNVIIKLNPPEGSVTADSKVGLADIQQVIGRAGNYYAREKGSEISPIEEQPEDSDSLLPLGIIVSYLIGGVLLRAYLSGDFSLHSLMNNFMGGFFIIFSLFKLINLSSFAEAYATYDVLAKRSHLYALTYPFIELLLGVAYFTGWQPVLINSITAILMAVGTYGVFLALQRKQQIQCACLGTALKLPMTKVTLLEDALMGIMALFMLITAH